MTATCVVTITLCVMKSHGRWWWSVHYSPCSYIENFVKIGLLIIVVDKCEFCFRDVLVGTAIKPTAVKWTRDRTIDNSYSGEDIVSLEISTRPTTHHRPTSFLDNTDPGRSSNSARPRYSRQPNDGPPPRSGFSTSWEADGCTADHHPSPCPLSTAPASAFRSVETRRRTTSAMTGAFDGTVAVPTTGGAYGRGLGIWKRAKTPDQLLSLYCFRASATCRVRSSRADRVTSESADDFPASQIV